MSDLLKRLRDRRKFNRIGITSLEPDCSDVDQPDCPDGYTAKCVADYYGTYRWKCLDTEGHEPDYEPQTLGPDPSSPEIYESTPVGNIGSALGIFTGKVSALNILRLRVHMGNEYGRLKGWHTVTFPATMEQAHVIGASGPRSAEVPVFEVRMARRTDYATAFATNVADIILDPIKSIIPNVWPLHEVIEDILKPMVGSLSRVIGEITYDIVVKPTLAVSQDIMNAALPRLPEAWGMDRERSVTTIDIKDITTTSFKWYSYGNMYINWIALGFLPADEPTPIPEEIAGPLEELNKIKDKLDQWEVRLQEILDKVELKLPGVTEPTPDEPIGGGGDYLMGIRRRRHKRY